MSEKYVLDNNVEALRNPRFLSALSYLSELALVDTECEYFLFVDLDSTLSSGLKAELMKYPFLERLFSFNNLIPQENIDSLKMLNQLLEGRVAIATNRNDDDIVWRSEELLEYTKSILEENECKIPIFTSLNKSLPQSVLNLFGIERLEEIVNWVKARTTKKEIKIVMVTDIDLIDKVTEIGYDSVNLVTMNFLNADNPFVRELVSKLNVDIRTSGLVININ